MFLYNVDMTKSHFLSHYVRHIVQNKHNTSVDIHMKKKFQDNPTRTIARARVLHVTRHRPSIRSSLKVSLGKRFLRDFERKPADSVTDVRQILRYPLSRGNRCRPMECTKL